MALTALNALLPALDRFRLMRVAANPKKDKSVVEQLDATIEILLEVGYTQAQLGEIAFGISGGCFYNRISTLMACPPEEKFERMASGPFRWLIAFAMPLMQKLAPKRN